MKTTILEYCKVFDKIFKNCITNRENAQSITSRNFTTKKASNIDSQPNSF